MTRRKKDLKKPKSLSVRESYLKRWDEAAEKLDMDLNTFMERAGNQLAAEVAEERVLSHTDQIAELTKVVQGLVSEMETMRKDMRAMAKALTHLELV